MGQNHKRTASLLVTFLVIAGGIGATAVWLNSAAVSIVITNKKCDTIRMPTILPVAIPGIQLPNQPISNAEQGIMKIPPLSVHIDASHTDMIIATVFTIPIPIPVPTNVQITFDQVPFTRTLEATFHLGEKPIHQLLIQCI